MTAVKKSIRKTRTTYVEPDDFFPRDIREKYGLGEYNNEVIEQDDKQSNEKTSELR